MIDLDVLHTEHPGLPPGLPEALATCAAIALQRRHEPGVQLTILLGAERVVEGLTWRARSARDAAMLDAKRATEDGAECIALAIVGRHRNWRLVRRLQSGRGEHADWLADDCASGRRIVLEISGTDDGPFERRVRQKRGQAALAATRGSPAVTVVRFLEPKVLLED